MFNFVRKIGNWFLMQAQELDELDAKVRTKITEQKLKAFGYGVLAGLLIPLFFK